VRKPDTRPIAWRLKRATSAARIVRFCLPRPFFGSHSCHEASGIVPHRPRRDSVGGFVGGVRNRRLRRVELRFRLSRWWPRSGREVFGRDPVTTEASEPLYATIEWDPNHLIETKPATVELSSTPGQSTQPTTRSKTSAMALPPEFRRMRLGACVDTKTRAFSSSGTNPPQANSVPPSRGKINHAGLDSVEMQL